MRYDSTLLGTLLLLIAFRAQAATWTLPEQDLVVDQWTTADGLPLDHVNDLALAADGTVWVATFDGLWTFDGRTFRPLAAPLAAALGGSRITMVELHPADGAVWVQVENQAVARLSDGKMELWSRYGAFGDQPLSFFREPDALWMGTDHGLYQLTDRPVRYRPELLPGSVAGTAPGGDGGRWVALADRVLRFAPDGAVRSFGVEDGLPKRIIDLRPLLNGGPWVFAGDEGPDAAFAWDGTRFSRSAGTILGPVACQPDGWVLSGPCPPRGGVGGRWSVSPHAVLHDGAEVLHLDPPVRMAVQAPDGDLWVATTGGGIYRLREAEARVVKAGGSGERVQRLWLEPGAQRPWILDYDGVWWTADGPLRGSVPLPGQNAPLLGAYLFRADGQTMATSVQGLLGVPQLGIASTVTRAGGYASATDARGRVLLAGPEGLFIEDDGHWRAWGPTPDDTRAVAALADGSLLVAELGRGLSRRWEDGRREAVGGERMRNTRHIRVAGGRAYVSTEDDGLCVIPDISLATAAWTARCVGLGAGLPTRGVHQTLEDGRGRTWMSTNRGIGVLPTRDLEAFADGGASPAPLFLTTADGMASAEANGGTDAGLFLTDGGILWAATQIGAAAIDTKRFELPAAPVARLIDVRVGDVPVDRSVDSPALVLESDHPALQIAWTAVALHHADQVRFRTRMDGEAWSPPSADSSASFRNLPPGPFRFEVQAGLSGAWGPPASLEGRRTPRLAEEPAAPWVLGALVALVVGGLALVRQRALRLRNVALERVVDERTASLRAQADVLAGQRDANARQRDEIATQRDEIERQRDRLSGLARKLEGLDELRSRMIVNLHHELRTPLSLVLGPLREIPPSARDHDTALVLRNAERLAKLVDQLADIARLESGETRLQARRVPLSEWVQRCVERFLALARGRRQVLTVLPAAEEVVAWVDPELLEKVLGNLVQNALKFTPEGGRVTVQLGRRGDFARVEVRDTGPGVAEEERERIFERLYQVERGDTRAYEGSGLGLAIAREVVELHGGEIGCAAGVDGGSTFWFTLPLGVGVLSHEEVDLGEHPDLASTAVDAEPEGVAPLVLVVEDHPDMRSYIAMSLAEGHRVLTAEDGAAGLALARRVRPQLVVSDVMMPRMDGIAMARAMRADPVLRDVPVVLVSARSGDSERAAGLELVDAWLTKPFHVPELRAHVRRLLARNVVGLSGERPAERPPDGESLGEADRVLLTRLERVVDARLADADLSVEILARTVGMSERTLQRELARILGVAPSTWIRERRLAAARELLGAGRVRTVGEAAAAVGMSRAYFTRAFHAWCGRAPGDELRDETAPRTRSPSGS